MDAGLALKPAASTTPTGDGRAAPVVRNAVATELAPAQAVSAATATAPTPYSGPSRLPETMLDPEAREVVYRAADVRSRRADRQAPEKAVLRTRQRAYTRAAAQGDDGDTPFDVMV